MRWNLSTTERQDTEIFYTEGRFLLIQVLEFCFRRICESFLLKIGLCYVWIPFKAGLTLLHIEVKQSLYMPGKALKVRGGRGSQISRQSTREGGNVVSPTHRPLYFRYGTVGRNTSMEISNDPWRSGLQRRASTNCTTASPLCCT